MKYEGVVINIQEGDIISSKLGILQESPISKKFYLVKKQKYLGNSHWIVIGDKEEVSNIKWENGKRV